MKNKKGFTLIELLIVIVLLVSIVGTSILGIDEISKKGREKQLSEIIKQIEMATDVYYENNEVYKLMLLNGEIESRCTRIYVLENEGLLDTNLINPVTNARIPGNLCVNSSLDENGEIVHNFEL